MTRSTQSDVQRLSEQAQVVLHRMLDQRAKPASIARAIKEQTGERITPRAVTTYGAAYRKRRASQVQISEKLDGFVSQVEKDGVPISDLLRAVLRERLQKAGEDGTAADLDLLKLEEHERKRSELELKERQSYYINRYREHEMEMKGRKQELAEKQFRLRRKQARASFAQLEQKAATGQPLTDDDMRNIRAIYGLDTPVASDK